jgi:hypothetical protein
MRQIIKNGLLTIAGLFFILAGNAQSIHADAEKDNSTVTVNVHQLTDQSKLRVIVMNPTQKRVDLIIKNKKGEVLFEQNTKMEGFSRDLNFAEMESDNYTVEIKSHNYLYTQELSLKDRVIEKKVELVPGTQVAIRSGE